MTDIQPFDFQGTKVRVLTDEQGEPWFVAADVAKVLGYSATAAMTRTLDEDERGVRSLHTPSGEQDMTVLTEGGLYSAILRSRVEGARAFKRWVTHDVLPAIRRTGGYSTTPAQVAVPTTMREALTMAMVALDRAEAAESKVAELEPVAEVAQRVLDAAGDFSLREAAQALCRDYAIETGQNRLLASLRTLGWVDSKGNAYQRRIESGHLKVLARTYDHPHAGEPTLSTQLRVTGKGVVALATALRPAQFRPLAAV